MVVNEFDRRIEIGNADNAQNRPEDLLLVDAHVRFHVIEKRATEEEAVLVAWRREATAVDHELGTGFDPILDIALDLAPCVHR